MENFKIVELTCKQMKSLNNNIFNFSKLNSHCTSQHPNPNEHQG